MYTRVHVHTHAYAQGGLGKGKQKRRVYPPRFETSLRAGLLDSTEDSRYSYPPFSAVPLAQDANNDVTMAAVSALQKQRPLCASGFSLLSLSLSLRPGNVITRACTAAALCRPVLQAIDSHPR